MSSAALLNGAINGDFHKNLQNKEFRRFQAIRLLHRMGVILPLWMDASSLENISRAIECMYWRELGYSKIPAQESIDSKQPVNRKQKSLELAELTSKLSSVKIPTSYNSSNAAINFERISTLLNLTQVEREWLLWAYCFSWFPMPNVALGSEQHGLAVIAALLGAKMEEMLHCVFPNRLRAMRLLEPPKYRADNESIMLSDWMRCSTYFQIILENEYQNATCLLEALRAPEEDWIASEDHSNPRLLMGVWLPPLVSESYLRIQMMKTLSGVHIASLVNWMCGWSLSADQFAEPIDASVAMALREAIKKRAINCSIENRRFTFQELQAVIY